MAGELISCQRTLYTGEFLRTGGVQPLVFVNKAKGLPRLAISFSRDCGHVSRMHQPLLGVCVNDNVSSITDRETETLERGIYILYRLLPRGRERGSGKGDSSLVGWQRVVYIIAH
jgi:hypothetical protein